MFSKYQNPQSVPHKTDFVMYFLQSEAFQHHNLAQEQQVLTAADSILLKR